MGFKKSSQQVSTPRRRFVQGLIAGGVLAAFPSVLHAASSLVAGTITGTVPELSGKVIDLVIDESPVNFTGVVRMATTINGSIPAPTLRLKEGDDVTIRVTNKLSVPSSIHWHGIILPYQMDGVPGISFKGIMPGETFVYKFKLQQSGTYWYHSHSGFQEMTGMYGALIIEPREKDIISADNEHVIQLSDWTDDDPMDLFRKLKVQSDVFNFNQPTVPEFFDDISNSSVSNALQRREMWNKMRMNPTDLADLSASAMTFLMNGSTPMSNWRGMFKAGEKVRLRFINGSSNTFFDVRIPELKLTVVQADGQNVEPVTVDEFRFGPGETYDVIVEPKNDAYTIFAQSMDRSGYAKGTLSSSPNIDAPVPALDPVEWLTMTDMMGNMTHGGEHSAMAGMAGMSGMNSKEMDHSAMDHGPMAMDHSKHGMSENPLAVASSKVRHAKTEYGASVDMRVDMPRTNLDDPGIGLRKNGRRVLTLADLHSLEGITNQQEPEAEIELHLTGNMERYSWSFDGLEFGKSTPVHMKHNQRLRVILQNDTMMTHPMHLHGMWSDLENEQGDVQVRRHTIPVQPAQRISFLTTPHDVGRWAWHCHLLFHMDAGMFREVVVS
ncbi:copper resistance protein A [Pseudoalteromonas sp. BSi20311]|nr:MULTISPECIES: copper resistance system multicopper oxidase [unclassified Pseudoalteromonas]MDC9573535.1 copper resistance system multicopper oxidase [Pseudoalteromonas sp. GABNS16A]MDC9587069.1 copper resistance system multicopper oxidase [Pseudoalteromonas sp. GABNS16C]MDC9600878.1 copper resistance system multicopper oxidase [Pseudoalteromonas sp. GABNS16G]MDC9609501.1 copper resistance system multicopper oxidase [Pseudoalteromonas sp. GABNS16H]GAA63018.1 copper resistance protein A [Pseu